MSVNDIYHGLVLEEYKAVNERISFVRKDLAQSETIGWAGILGSYTWLLGDAPSEQWYHAFLYAVPFLISLFIYIRIQWRLEVTKIAEEHIRSIERIIANSEFGKHHQYQGYEMLYEKRKPARYWFNARNHIYRAISIVTFAIFIFRIASIS